MGDLVARLAASFGLEPHVIIEIDTGWDSDVFDLDHEWIVRIPRRPAVVAGHEREKRLLPALAEAMPFAVPLPHAAGEFEGVPFMIYRRLPGRPLTEADDMASVGNAIAALHAFPVERAAALVGTEPTMAEWAADYERLRATTVERVVPQLDAALVSRLDAAWDALLATDWNALTPVLVHRDLGAEHLLVDNEGVLTGIIDFGDVTIGDATIDFVGLLITCGEPATRRALGAYARECHVDWARMRAYVWLGAVHAILYGLEIGDDAEVAGGIEGLDRRLPR